MLQILAIAAVLLINGALLYFTKELATSINLGVTSLAMSVLQCLTFGLVAFFTHRSILKIKHRALPPISFKSIVLILSMVFGAMISNVGIQLTQARIHGFTYVDQDMSAEDYQQTNAADSSDPNILALERAAATLFNILGEEIVFRFLVLGTLLTFFSPLRSVFVSSILFAFWHTILPLHYHFGDWYQVFNSVLPTFAMGLFFGAAYLRGGLAASALVHFAINLIATFRSDTTIIADSIIFGSAFIAIIVLPPTLWLTRKSRLSAGNTVFEA